ncbi:MAG TPA: tetratricopeptide repeat protein, partial [Steroidobacteraceae bacterium]|nr:tetratricopeptide repeat protein [Steroidobacteraceae bacterium]
SYAANAEYWIGWTYYVHRDFAPALRAFQTVVDGYTSSPKVPDALLNVGYCDAELKRVAEARRVFGEVIAKYPGTSAARLAAKRLAGMRAEPH